jgi:thiol-disulfide isomerase/thioredoxin
MVLTPIQGSKMKGCFRIFLVLAAILVSAVATAGDEKLADFKLNQLSGPPVSLSDYTDKSVVVIPFWATWCSPCMAMMPHIQKLHERYGDKGLTILSLNTDEARNRAKVLSMVKTKGMTYTVLLDSETEVLSQLNPVMNLPYTVVVAKDGTVHSRHSGFHPGDEEALEKEIRVLLGL